MTSLLQPRKRKFEALETDRSSAEDPDFLQSSQTNSITGPKHSAPLTVPESTSSFDRHASIAPRSFNSRSGITPLILASSTSSQPLCAKCASVDFSVARPDPGGEWNRSSVLIGKLSDIVLDPECPLCQLFSSMASLTQPGNASNLNIKFRLCSFYTSAMYGHNWRNSRGIIKQDSISYAVIDDISLRDRQSYFTKERKLSNDLWASRTAIQKSGWLSPINDPNSVSHRFSANLLQAKVDFGTLRGWLDFCATNHVKTCTLSNTRPLLGLKVIDCEKGAIVDAPHECDYLALSYVWGSSASVDQSSQQDMNLLDGTAPNLVKDAIIVTKRLGYRYLWVDRYCIPQHAEERHSQINQMDLVYSKAQATIIAAASNDPDTGLAGVESKLRSPSVTVKIGDELYAYVPPDPGRQILQSSWNSRGWTHQETILSRRRIFFCSTQVYFECTGMRCCDAIDVPLELLHTTNLRVFSKWNRPGLFEPVRRKQYPLDDIRDHLAEYTRRSFTRPEDTLNGIMGTFHAFENVYGSFKHYWGIPIVPDRTLGADRGSMRLSTRVEQFLTGLCWYFAAGGKRRTGFPSWSWAGWFGKLKPHVEYDGYIRNTYGVKIWLESIFPSMLDLQTFCDSPAENFPTYKNPYILIEALFLHVRFRHLSRISGPNVRSQWQAILDLDNGGSIHAPFFLTHDLKVGDELHEKLLSRVWNGFIMGDRLKTYYSGAGKAGKRVLNNAAAGSSPHVIIMVVDEQENMAERLGIVEIDTRIDRDNLRGAREQMRTIRLG